MAVFKGTLEEFLDFVGPLTRNIVCNMARKLKKGTTCRHEGCNRRKPLEAAHIKGKERTGIVANILSNFQLEGNNLYEVDLHQFKAEFIAAHDPIHEVILPMCKEHHLEYDRRENIEEEYPIILDEFENEGGEESYTQEKLKEIESKELERIRVELTKTPFSVIKEEVCEKYNLKSGQVAFSRISEANSLWNFDVKKEKFDSEFAFIFYNQNKEEYHVALVEANTLLVSEFPTKNEHSIRFLVGNDYKDKTGFDFKSILLKNNN